MAKEFKKFVGEIETFAIDWTNYLADANNGAADTIATATWTIEPTGLTKVTDSIDGDTDRTLIQVSGGTVDTTYTCWCQITLTSGSDTPKRYLRVKVLDDDTT